MVNMFQCDNNVKFVFNLCYVPPLSFPLLSFDPHDSILFIEFKQIPSQYLQCKKKRKKKKEEEQTKKHKKRFHGK